MLPKLKLRGKRETDKKKVNRTSVTMGNMKSWSPRRREEQILKEKSLEK